MKNSKWNKWFAMTACIVAGSLMLVGCGDGDSGKESEKGTPEQYTIEVLTEGGKALEDVGVYVYTDASQKDLVGAGETDDEGKLSFQATDAEDCVIVLKDVPRGYVLEDTYVVTDNDTQVVLKSKLLSTEEIADVTFELGDVFVDMSVEADGKTYTISELLKEKKAVVLNFWYLNCGPCKMEFPFLQESYAANKDKIEVLALNPVDGTKETVDAFKSENKLTFPMAACDAKWEKTMKLSAYPTTIVIDRYGTIAFMHRGSITETETFDKIFAYFTAEDYKQVAVRNLKDLK